MWTKSYSVTTKEVTKEQIWALFTDVNKWHVWNNQIEFAKLEGKFEAGNSYQIKPKNGRTVTVTLQEVTEFEHCLETGNFPLAKMYYDHRIEETADGIKITNTITLKGLLSFLWVQLVVKKIAAEMPSHVEQQIKVASKLKVSGN
ncbi:MAG: SRPBCC family protein [Bacteroidetes bacterium]|nr:SRPBCC family protein [Bacteroidota bacterium]